MALPFDEPFRGHLIQLCLVVVADHMPNCLNCIFFAFRD